MKRNLGVMIMLSFFLLMGVKVKAQTQIDRTDVRQASQRTRMAEGRASGEITKREAKLLRSEQRRIRRSERRMEADGVVTQREQARIQAKQNRASRHIRRAKHNGIEE